MTTVFKAVFYTAPLYIWAAIVIGGQATSSIWFWSQACLRRAERADEALCPEDRALRKCVLKSLAPPLKETDSPAGV